MASIIDVAAKAGVSKSTVSRVMTMAGSVSEETRELVLEAARQLNYQPNISARNLRRNARDKKSLKYMVGLILLDITIFPTDPFFIELFSGIERALRERSFGIRIFSSPRDGEIPSEIKDGAVDGVIFQQASGSLIPAVSALLPAVTYGGYHPENGAYGIIPDITAGVAKATGLLLKAGHRRLTVLSTHPQPAAGSVSFMDMVAEGVTRAFKKHGKDAEPPVFLPVAGQPETGYLRGRELFRNKADRPDAVIASDGAMPGLYRAAREQDLRIPDDISFVGFDGVAAGEYFDPPLTTCDAHIRAIGETMVRVLTEMIDKDTPMNGMELTPMSFVKRESARV